MKTPQKLAVIDVGSNSIRMVIYERAGAALLPYFNEKTMAELGRGLQNSGCLNPEGAAIGLETLERFRAILTSLGITDVFAVATAAVRVADDGDQFRIKAEKALGVPLRVLSGPEEGRLSAKGVRLGFNDATGLVADLGGSSLELCPLDTETSPTGETYLLGALARTTDDELTVSKRRKQIRNAISDSNLLAARPKTLYAVGGSWRNVAAVHMMLNNYPLGVIHAKKLTRRDLDRVIEAADGARHHKSIRQNLQSVAKRRYQSLLHVALVLDTLLEQAGLNEVVMSAYGLREGVLAEGADIFGDGLIDSVDLFLRLPDASRAFGLELFQFVLPILDRLDVSKTLTQAICLMADAGGRMHPDHRVNLVFDQVLRAPLPNLKHSDRIFAALSVASRYSANFELAPDLAAITASKARVRARTLGTAMRLAAVFSGRSAALLSRAQLEVSESQLYLHIREEDHALVSETVRRRHKQLAEALGLEAVQAFSVENV